MMTADKAMKHIALNIDNRYVQHCSVLMASICRNNGKGVCFHILYLQLSEKSRETLSLLAEKFGSTVRFYEIDETYLSDLPTTEKWSHSIYLRLFIPKFVSDEINRVLYLDCDMVVRGDLEELWNTDLTGKAAAVVEDLHHFNSPMIERLGYDPYESYFNSGMLLMNLDYFRRFGIVEKLFKYMKDNLSLLIHPDQDALNAVLHGQCVFVHCRWNFHYRYQVSYLCPQLFLQSDLAGRAKRTPVILHFSEFKPWNMNCDSPYKGEYFKYLADTEFSGYKIPMDWSYFLSQRYVGSTKNIQVSKMVKYFIRQIGITGWLIITYFGLISPLLKYAIPVPVSMIVVPLAMIVLGVVAYVKVKKGKPYLIMPYCWWHLSL